MAITGAWAQVDEEEAPMGESFLFSFMTGEADIQASYGNNAIEIERLNQKVWPAITPLMDAHAWQQVPSWSGCGCFTGLPVPGGRRYLIS